MRSKGHRRHGGSWVPRQGRPSQAIIESNRKTELCRNWESKGVCSFGARCAFAHGEEELRYRTLREMENAGRIPDATKYRCYPCMTWVATGSCPYSSRCVFIHDPRIKGPREAWLYAGSQGKSQSAYPSSDNCFFFPDMVRDPDTLELPTHPARYDLDPFMARAQDVGTRAVYSLWYSFLSTLLEAAAKNNTASTTLSSSSSSSSSRASSNHTYEEAVSAPTSDSSRASADRALLPRPQRPQRAASVTTIPAAAAAAARGGGTAKSSVAASPLALKRCASLPPTLAPEVVPIPCEEVQHLPVFSWLSRGVPARTVTPPFPGRTSAEALQLDGAPDRFDPPRKRASSSTWNGIPPEFLLDALAPLPPSSCAKTKNTIFDDASRCRALIDVADVSDCTAAVSPGSNTGSNTNSTATFSPPSTLSPSNSDCGQFSRRHSSFPSSRGKTALSNGRAVVDEPHCWSLYGGECLAIGEMAVPPQLRGSLKAAAPAASSGGVSPSRVRNGYAVTHHRKQQLQEQQQERQLQQHNRAGVDTAVQTSVSSLFTLPSF